MKKEELIKLCIFCDDAVVTYPFNDSANKYYPVIRHKSNNKWFALIFKQNNKLFINLKSNPIDSAILRDTYDFILPAWHMNKKHWISVCFNQDVPDKIIQELVRQSHDRVVASLSKKERELLEEMQ